MALLDWSMTLVGYPAHRLSGQPVVGMSHMPGYQALRLAQRCGFDRGWLITGGPQPLFVDLEPEAAHWVLVEELFSSDRVAVTDGLVGGEVLFLPAADESERLPEVASLLTWAGETGRPWLQMIDNEWCRWGALPEDAIDALLLAFLAQRPLELEDDSAGFDPEVAAVLRDGLFDHGWTRNGELVLDGRRPTVALWGGVHGRSPLGPDSARLLSVVQRGIELRLVDRSWRLAALASDCPLDDETGRLAPRLRPS